MNKENWKVVVEFVGALSIVASLIFVGLEVRQSGRSALDSALSSDAALIVDTEALVLAHPDVWFRGCAGEPLEGPDAVIYSHIYHAYLFQYFLRWVRNDRGMAAASADMAIDNVAMNIHRYPGFRAEWDRHGGARYHVPEDVSLQAFRRAVEERLAEYERFEPAPLDVAGRCGLN